MALDALGSHWHLAVALAAIPALCYLFFDALIWQPFRRSLLASCGEFNGIERLGAKRRGSKLKGTCVVAGGSLAGLLTARVMTDHFEKVVMVEPDNQLEERRGRVPQWLHAHLFGNAFYQAIRFLFPDVFDEEATKAGIFLNDIGLGSTIFGDRRLPSCETGCMVLGSSRMSMERFLRRMLARTQSEIVTIRGSVVGLISSADGQHVDAITIKQEQDEVQRALPVSLVVDCTGNAACGPRWLEQPSRVDVKDELGPEQHAWEAPRRLGYKPSLTYYSALVKVRPEDMGSLPKPPAAEGKSWDQIGFMCAALPSLLASKNLAAIGHGEMGLFTFLAGVGLNDSTRVKTLADFREVMQSVEREVIGGDLPQWQHRLLEAFIKLEQDGEIQVEFKPYRNGLTWYNRYFELDRLPANFASVGDSLSNTNPRFAMGTRKIISELCVLNAMLHDLDAAALPRKEHGASSPTLSDADVVDVVQEKLPATFSKQFFTLAHKRDIQIWEFCQGEDYGSDATQLVDEGDSLGRFWFQRWYRLALSRVAEKDANVGNLVIRLIGSDSTMAPIDLLHPKLFGRAMMRLPTVYLAYRSRQRAAGIDQTKAV